MWLNGTVAVALGSDKVSLNSSQNGHHPERLAGRVLFVATINRVTSTESPWLPRSFYRDRRPTKVPGIRCNEASNNSGSGPGCMKQPEPLVKAMNGLLTGIVSSTRRG